MTRAAINLHGMAGAVAGSRVNAVIAYLPSRSGGH